MQQHVLGKNYPFEDIKNGKVNTGDINNIIFDIGKTYLTLVDLNVRTGAGTEYRIKKYSELTVDGKKHAYLQNNAVLKKGTKVTCLGIYLKDNEIWLKIPSGFVCANYNGKEYIR